MTIFEKWARVPKAQPFLFHLGTVLVILAMTFLIYRDTFGYQYLDWDDNTLVQQNPYVINPPYGQHAIDMFVPGRTPGPHLPLRNASYIFDREVLGKNLPLYSQNPAVWTKPMVHHVVNVLLYMLDGLVLLWLLRKTLAPWAAVIATLIWVAHPVHAEGVCWVSGRKEMLAAGFTFASLLAYIYATEMLGPDDAKPRTLLASLALVVGAAIVSAVAIYHPVTHTGFVQGLLSLGLLLAGCVAYGVRSGGDRRWQSGILFAAASFFALCGALSKPVAICIPPIILAWELGFRPRRKSPAVPMPPPVPGVPLLTRIRTLEIPAAIEAARVWFRDEFAGAFARLAPQGAIALWGAWMTLFLAGKTQVLKDANFNAAPKSRDISAFSALWLDIYHLIAPLDLSALYDVKSENWISKSSLFGFEVTWSPAAAGLLILIAFPFVCIWLLRRNSRSLLWLFFWAIPLIPVSGIVRIAAAHADRYLNIPAVAIAVGLGALLSVAAFGNDEETGPWERILAVVLCFVIIGGFSMISSSRVGVWKNNELLWGDAVRKNPDLPSARNNYGAALMNDGKAQEALEQYMAAYKIMPNLDVAQFNIAATLTRFKRYDEAQKYADEFLAQHKEMPTGYMLVGQLHSAKGAQCQQANYPAEECDKEYAQAEEAYKGGCYVDVDVDAILQKQDKAQACNQLAVVRTLRGDEAGAIKAWDDGVGFAKNADQRIFNTLIMTRARWKMSKKTPEMITGAIKDLESIQRSGDPDVIRLLAQCSLEMIRFTKDNKEQDRLEERALELMQTIIDGGRPNQHDVDGWRLLKDRAERRAKGEIVAPIPLGPTDTTPAPKSKTAAHTTGGKISLTPAVTPKLKTATRTTSGKASLTPTPLAR